MAGQILNSLVLTAKVWVWATTSGVGHLMVTGSAFGKANSGQLERAACHGERSGTMAMSLVCCMVPYFACTNMPVTGVLVDLNRRTMSFTLDGNYSRPMGIAFENIAFIGGIMPALTCNPGFTGKLNFGSAPFKYFEL